MLMNRQFICRALVTFLVFAGLQTILNAARLGRHSPHFSDECHRELVYCTLRAGLQYVGLKDNEALAKARAIPLAKHCTDWGAAMVCNRQQLRSEACQNATSADTKKIIKFIEATDLVVNYACKQNFRMFSNIYHCLLNRAVYTSMKDQCKDLKFNATNVCEKMPALIECSAKGVVARCGSDAGNVVRELGPKLSEIMNEAIYDRKCSPSERDDVTDLLKRFFLRK